MAVAVVSGALQGVDAIPIRVEVDLLRRLPAMSIVGLAAGAVKESAERIRSAIEAVGEPFPRKRIVVNLAPADVRKEGTALDLPIALGILAAQGCLPVDRIERILAVGELALGGELRSIRGGLSLSLLARAQGRTLVVPRACAAAAALVPDVDVVGADHLLDVVQWLRGERTLPPAPHNPAQVPDATMDLSEVRGQTLARQALEIAAAGAHHLLLLGPPGCGKSMLARRLPTILPPMAFEEALETTRVYSAAGLLQQDALMSERPFRAPHHSVTVAGLCGDRTLRPGELSLAHNGVLFLDEAPEFSRSALEVLRQPLEEGVVHLSRAAGSVVYPASITLVLALNPCPCGKHGTDRCDCGLGAISRYLRRLSGPLLDRVDLHVSMQPVTAQALVMGPKGESSAQVRARVLQARAAQRARGQTCPNGHLSAAQLDQVAPLDTEARETLMVAATKGALSSRAMKRIQRVARTLADLDGTPQLTAGHILRAYAFRASDQLD